MEVLCYEPSKIRINSKKTLIMDFLAGDIVIKIDGELYFLESTNGKGIEFDINKNCIVNDNAIYRFTNNTVFTLRDLAEKSNLIAVIKTYTSRFVTKLQKLNEPQITPETEKLIAEIEKKNLEWLIDFALDTGDKELFYKLIKGP